jgi:hypothetical protein
MTLQHGWLTDEQAADSQELRKNITQGRRKEFAAFPEYSDRSIRRRIPDPQARKTSRFGLEASERRHSSRKLVSKVSRRGDAALTERKLGENADAGSRPQARGRFRQADEDLRAQRFISRRSAAIRSFSSVSQIW